MPWSSIVALAASSFRRRTISWASLRPFSSRKTATFSFIIVPSSSRISDTRRPPVRFMMSAISRAWSLTAARDGVGIVMWPARSAACSPERRPKISVSSSEFAPRRLPPWTETQATSPAAYRPGIDVAPLTSDLTPPMM